MKTKPIEEKISWKKNLRERMFEPRCTVMDVGYDETWKNMLFECVVSWVKEGVKEEIKSEQLKLVERIEKDIKEIPYYHDMKSLIDVESLRKRLLPELDQIEKELNER